ncbi:hypothetical protein J2X46_003556 [Nocardioides sp. BE266]|uniref:hypothetical protein n=1 Tax=Nocardioides sp. BE266 TaxID=2817725 RepID=UPI00285A6AF4|nr:hypothetical protein [Nocardioides sp. BE266]MDR7254563.1 hypothetical protein [Nocardioides sp. BE266]
MTSTVLTRTTTDSVPAYADRQARIRFIATAAGLLVGGLGYFLTLLNYSTDIGRTALGGGYFSNFFDDQARAILDGHLDMDPQSLAIEGFVHDGKTFTYFPPFPALLRLPVLMTTHEFDYQLTLLSMAVAWIVLAVMATKLIWLLLDHLVEGDLTWRSGTLAGIFVAGATGGTFLTYDASLPWVYHEVYTWAVAAAVGGLYWMVRTCLAPSTHTVFWLAVFALVTVGCRTTEGWAICLGAIGLGLLVRFRPFSAEHRRLWWRILLAGVGPLCASIALNLYKFDAIYMFPLKDQVWTQVNQHRQDALAANDGTLSGPQFFTTSFMAYLRPDGIRFTDYFPWITLPAQPAKAYNGAFVDQAYRTGSVTGFMWIFMLLMVLAVVVAFWPRLDPVAARLRVPLVASVLCTGGVMTYGYYSTRYSSDFVPAMVLGGAIGTALLARFVSRRRRWTVPVTGLLAFGMVFAVLAQMAIGLFMAASLHRGEALQRYVAWQADLSPGAQSRLISHVDGLPEGGHTDDLAIRGDCEALYLHTGDQYEPWVPVEERDRVWRFQVTGDLAPGKVKILDISGAQDQSVWLDVREDRLVRPILYKGDEAVRGELFEIPTDGQFALGIRNLLDVGFFRLETSPGGAFGYTESVYFNDDWDSLPSLAEDAYTDQELADHGLSVTPELGLPIPLCERLAEQAGLALGTS